MEHEGYISKTALSVAALWLVVVLLVVAAWLVILVKPDHWRVGGMLAASSCVLGSFTATIHNRLYVRRICGVVRATSGLDDARVHAIR